MKDRSIDKLRRYRKIMRACIFAMSNVEDFSLSLSACLHTHMQTLLAMRYKEARSSGYRQCALPQVQQVKRGEMHKLPSS